MASPSGLNAANHTAPVCGKVARSFPVATSQRRAELSSLALKRVRPSGLKTTVFTAASWRRHNRKRGSSRIKFPALTASIGSSGAAFIAAEISSSASEKSPAAINASACIEMC
jgi:hypothetical protein